MSNNSNRIRVIFPPELRTSEKYHVFIRPRRLHIPSQSHRSESSFNNNQQDKAYYTQSYKSLVRDIVKLYPVMATCDFRVEA